ncbi:15459_t:CDS:2, partial [Cetraspora pellucida]
MPYGQLEVTVDKVNPYVTLSLDKANVKKTHTLQNSGSDATWDKLIHFDIVEGRYELYLQVFNEREATIPLEAVFQTGSADQWIHIARPSGKGAGEIRLLLKFSKQGPTSGPAGSTPYPLPEHNNSYFSRPQFDSDYPRTPSYRDGNVYNSLSPVLGATPAGYGSGDPPQITLPNVLRNTNIPPLQHPKFNMPPTAYPQHHSE